MPYVMMPVPEEHVEEAMAAVLRIIARGRLVDWDAPSINTLFASLDEGTKALLGTVARAVGTGKQVPQRAAADMIELTERELLGITRELGERCTEEGRPSILMNVAASETLPNGRVRETRVFTMPDEIAEWVREAEKADLGNSHPLIGNDG